MSFDQKIQKRVKGKLPDYEIKVATRKIEINAMEDYTDIYIKSMSWIDEILEAAKKKEHKSYSEHLCIATAIHFSFKKLRIDKDSLRGNDLVHERKLKRVSKILKSLDRYDDAKSMAAEFQVGEQEINMGFYGMKNNIKLIQGYLSAIVTREEWFFRVRGDKQKQEAEKGTK